MRHCSARRRAATAPSRSRTPATPFTTSSRTGSQAMSPGRTSTRSADPGTSSHLRGCRSARHPLPTVTARKPPLFRRWLPNCSRSGVVVLDVDGYVWFDAGERRQDVVQHLVGSRTKSSPTCRHLHPAGLVSVVALRGGLSPDQDDVDLVGEVQALSDGPWHRLSAARPSP